MKRKQWHMWFACLAILLNALSPSLSYAFASLHANANNAAVEICSASGAVYTQADLAPAATSPTDSVLHHIEHCPFCMNHAGSVGLPPPSSSPLAVITGHDRYPALSYEAPQPQFAWLSASPRGPPALA
ncbi:DUF2946 domain-containing protein [Janthinobacterium sp. 1_2014MBL_MicDiv]|uniref:DUF2946 domain-containing protein n=1 Tax=Janthinobacterium sp. 1_2014MBL_MicDiv TaxID=1644131 RepID=UPI001E56B280|nr:DUF2946 domain-containing protein [Janthinobacterium sp. 1_2014MBL_MicDiv]